MHPQHVVSPNRFPRLVDALPVEGKCVFLRLDLNVALADDGTILNPHRIKAALPTLQHLLERKARVVVASHLGRPRGRVADLSLATIGTYLATATKHEVILMDHFDEEPADQMLRQLRPGQFILLENLRYVDGETKGEPDFARMLMKGLDFYVNDAFGCLHRSDTSLTLAPQQIAEDRRAIGFLVAKELEALEAIVRRPAQPFVVVVGGRKLRNRVGPILELLKICQHLCIAGELAATFLAAQQRPTGLARVDHEAFPLVEAIVRTAAAHRVQIHLPEDFCLETGDHVTTIPHNNLMVDIGPHTQRAWAQLVRNAATVFWTGPVGITEQAHVAAGTSQLAHALSECRGQTVVAGKSTAGALAQLGLLDAPTHCSTGGGAALAYLEGRTLAGLKALR